MRLFLNRTRDLKSCHVLPPRSGAAAITPSEANCFGFAFRFSVMGAPLLGRKVVVELLKVAIEDFVSHPLEKVAFRSRQ